ncbi:MAG: TatD family hydrolase [DPANN group archaeon]|nr:TatD family hydrolase [DPANN group archaeon]
MEQMKVIDIHCHLQHEMFDKDREQIIKTAKNKMQFLIISGARPDWNRDAIKLSEENPNFVYATIGVHPIDLQKMTEDEFEKELTYTKEVSDKIVGIGEVGLDYHWEKDETKQKIQSERFKRYIQLANKLEKPLIIHSWEADKETIKILHDNNAKSVVMHCFSGKLDTLKEALSLGYYISFSTMIAFSKHHKKLAKNTPLDKIFLETDSPYLDPTHIRNVPWNTLIVAEKIAKVKDLTKEEVIFAAINNAKKVFGIK